MIRIFDRYLVGIFVRSFFICFSSLVGLYIVIDAFSKLDEFSERCSGLSSLLATMGTYYLYRVSLFFDRLAGVITTVSAMFTFSWIQRTNELMPLLAAGVPIHRVIAPVLIAAMGVSGLTTANQELVIPRIANKLQMRPDHDASQTVTAHAAYDPRGILFSGEQCFRQELKVTPAFITLQQKVSGSLLELRAAEAIYVPPSRKKPSGGWLLYGVTPEDPQCSETVLQSVEGGYFLHTTVTFDQIMQKQSWFEFLSSRTLMERIREPGNRARNEMEVLLHTRLTRPLATLTLLFLGLPFVLSGTDRRMVSLLGISLVISIAFQLFCQMCIRLGYAELIDPKLAAWLPVLVFGTVAVALYDLVRT